MMNLNLSILRLSVEGGEETVMDDSELTDCNYWIVTTQTTLTYMTMSQLLPVTSERCVAGYI